jgi:hypothetical protein
LVVDLHHFIRFEAARLQKILFFTGDNLASSPEARKVIGGSISHQNPRMASIRVNNFISLPFSIRDWDRKFS